MKLTIILTALIVSSTLFSQIPTLDWVKQTGGSENSLGHSLSVDNFGNTYTSGIFAGTIDCDPGPGVFPLTSGSAGYNAFITKLDPSGNLVWAKGFICTGSSTVHSTVIDNQSNIYLTGYFKGTCDFDPDPSTSFNLTSTGSNEDAFVCKLNANGEFIWAKNTGSGTLFAAPNDIELDLQGNVITVGKFNGLVDFDPGPGVFNLSATNTAFPNGDVFVSKLDSNGTFIWAKQIGSDSGNDEAYNLSIDSSGSIYFCGRYTDSVDFDPNGGVFNLIANGTNAFVCKLDASGNFAWAGAFGGTGSNACDAYSLVTSSTGKVYISGRFAGTIDFDPGIGIANKIANGPSDLFILELDTSGNFNWVKSIGSPQLELSITVQLDNSGNIYLHGIFQDTVDFDPGPDTYNLVSIGSFSHFICKLTNTGTFVWAVGLGHPPLLGRANLMIVDDSDNIYCTGRFIGTTDFDPDTTVFNLTPVSNSDCFTLKLNPCTSSIPALSISSSEGDTICVGSNVTFTASANNGGSSPSYQWMINGVDFGVDSISYSSSTLVSGDIVTCELTSNDPCAASTYTTSNAISMVVGQPTSGSDTQIACESFTWIDGNTYTSPNNTATYVVVSSLGCDSVVTLDLTFEALDTSVSNSDPTLTANATGVSYQWVDCDNSFMPVPGETNSSFTPTSNGTYAVIVSSNGCSDTSSCIPITTVGFEEMVSDVFTIYPNPTSGKLSVDYPSRNGNVRLKISNTLGQVVVDKTFRLEEELTLSVVNSENGFYIVEIETEEGKIVKGTFVKNL